MSKYFPEPKSSGGRVKVELNLVKYSTKADLKNAVGVDTSKFTEKVDLASLKSCVDNLNIDKLKNVPTNSNNLKSKVDELDVDQLVLVPVNSSKLSDAVKNDVVKKDACKAKIKYIEDKIPYITNLASNTTLNAKINEVKNKIPNITDLATTTVFTAIENKIPNLSNLVKKKLIITQKLVKLKIKLLLVIIIINILQLTNLISKHQNNLLQR